VSTRYQREVSSAEIDGLAGAKAAGPLGRLVILTSTDSEDVQGRGPSTNVRPGDHIWLGNWHDWSESEGIRAVVGSYPQPFFSNESRQSAAPYAWNAQECMGDACSHCHCTGLRAQHVPAAVEALGAGSRLGANKTGGVGTWREIAGVSIARTERRPRQRERRLCALLAIGRHASAFFFFCWTNSRPVRLRDAGGGRGIDRSQPPQRRRCTREGCWTAPTAEWTRAANTSFDARR